MSRTNNERSPMTSRIENSPVQEENNHQLASATPTRYHPFGFEDMAKRFRFPSSFFSDPFFTGSEEDNFDSENRFSKMMEPFTHEFKGFGGSSSFFGEDNQLSNYTQKLFDEIINKDTEKEGEEIAFPSEDPNTEVLNHPKELEDLYSKYKAEGSEGNSFVTGRSYVSLTISRNGKSITVSKHSELTPEGTIKTRLNQKFRDNEGRKKKRTWNKALDLKGNQSSMLENNCN